MKPNFDELRIWRHNLNVVMSSYERVEETITAMSNARSLNEVYRLFGEVCNVFYLDELTEFLRNKQEQLKNDALKMLEDLK